MGWKCNISFFRFVKLRSCHHLNGLEFLVFIHVDIHIANSWHSNVDSEIKQIRSIHQGHRQSIFFVFKGPPTATAHAYK